MSRCLYSMLYIISFTIKNHLLPRYGNSPKHSDKNRTGNEKLTNLSFPVFLILFRTKKIKNAHKTASITISVKDHSEPEFSDKRISSNHRCVFPVYNIIGVFLPTGATILADFSKTWSVKI